MSTLPLIVHSLKLPSRPRQALKWITLGYAVKTAAFGVAWYFVPDLPQRLLAGAQAAWAWVMAP